MLNSQVQDLTFDNIVEYGSKTASKKLSNLRVRIREDQDDFNF
jgi:hypothetical protein